MGASRPIVRSHSLRRCLPSQELLFNTSRVRSLKEYPDIMISLVRLNFLILVDEEESSWKEQQAFPPPIPLPHQPSTLFLGQPGSKQNNVIVTECSVTSKEKGTLDSVR